MSLRSPIKLSWGICRSSFCCSSIYDVLATVAETLNTRAQFMVPQEWMRQLQAIPNPEILFGITAYNEPGTALLVSLAGVKQNLDYLVQVGKRSLAQQITLCLIFDGRDRISPSALKLLEALEILPSEPMESISGVQIFESCLKLDRIQQLMALEMATERSDNPWLEVYQTAQLENRLPDRAQSLESIRVLVCMKDKNVGKLNSHWWFFQVFSTYLQPNYCIQMDVGCVPQAGNVHDLWKFLEQNPDVGGAAGSLLVPEPDAPWHFTGLWQFGNFCLDKLLFSPAEDISGYLSVLPGQFSMLRWSALKPNDVEDAPGLQRSSPLDRYFRGLGQLNLFESNMFLAEDRILGFDIVTAPNCHWRLAHLSSVVTVTDACQSLSELLRQRRRWINGSFTCRLWSFAQLPQYLVNPDASLPSKGRLLRSIPLQLLKTFTDWFYPALLIVVFALICQTTETILLNMDWPTGLINWPFRIGLVLLAYQTIACLVGKPSRILWLITVISGSLSLFTILSFWLGTGYYLPGLLIVLALGIIFAISKIHSPWLGTKIWQYVPLYLLIHSLMKFLLQVYSFCNINDCSWGTKGLTTKPRIFSSNQLLYVSFWLASNILLIGLAFAFKFSIELLGVILLGWAIGLISGLLRAGKIKFAQID
jgi:chitin synthase